MAKAAKSGQARDFSAMIISRIDEEALEYIHSEKIQNAIDKPESFIHSLIRFINNDCHVATGPLVVGFDRTPGSLRHSLRVENDLVVNVKINEPSEPVLFESGRVTFIGKSKIDQTYISALEYKKLLKDDKTITVGNANAVEFFENHQFDPAVAKKLELYKSKDLYQFGTIYDGFSHDLFSYLYWNGELWCSGTKHFDNNCILDGYAIVVSNN
jgi:hypothetical protein